MNWICIFLRFFLPFRNQSMRSHLIFWSEIFEKCLYCMFVVCSRTQQMKQTPTFFPTCTCDGNFTYIGYWYNLKRCLITFHTHTYRFSHSRWIILKLHFVLKSNMLFCFYGRRSKHDKSAFRKEVQLNRNRRNLLQVVSFTGKFIIHWIIWSIVCCKNTCTTCKTAGLI